MQSEPRQRAAGHVSFAVWLSVAVAAAWHVPSLAAESGLDASRLREPVALAISPAGKLLYVANRHSGSISILDLGERRIIGETVVGWRLSDMVMTRDGRLLATDEAAHHLLVLETDPPHVKVTHRVELSPYPVSVAASRDGRWCSVASRWSRRATFVSLPRTADDAARIRDVVNISFAPGKQLLVRDDHLLILADSFGGRLGVVDTTEGRLLHVHELGVHNIRGIQKTRDGRWLIMTHQRLHANAPTTQDDIHWGRVISNAVFWLDFDAVAGTGHDVFLGARVSAVDREARGAGDPAGVAVARGGTTIAALSGVSQIAISNTLGASYERLAVGTRPTAVTLSPDGQRAFVANTFDDSISVVDLGARQETYRISLGPRPELTLAQQGERLFYDARLSHDGWMSCHSCHTDGHTSDQLADTPGDGTFGTPKRILSLLGVRDTPPYAWNGNRSGLEEQIRASIRNTMHADYEQRKRLTSKVDALAAYLASLDPPPSVQTARGQSDPIAAARGRRVFTELSCHHCHSPAEFTSSRTFDVGLVDEQGQAEFNPPSLRGLSQRQSFLHDGRCATLHDLLIGLGHPTPHELSQENWRDLRAYLESL